MPSTQSQITFLVSSAQRFIKGYFLPAMLFLFIIGFFWTDLFWADGYHDLKRFFNRFLIFPALISFQMVDYRRIYKLIPIRFFFLFVGYLSLSLSWSSYTSDDVFYRYILYGFYIACFIIIIITSTQYNYKWLMLIGFGFIFIASFHVLVAAWLWYREHSLTDRLESPGILNQSIEMATIYSAIAAYCAISYLRNKDKASIIYLIPLTICLGGIVLTGSRGPLFTCLLLMILAALLIRNRRAKLLFVLISLTGLALILIEHNLFHFLSERGASYRPAIWVKAWSKITESWIFGHGIAATPELILDDQTKIYHFHNIFLATWYYGGIIGMLLLVIMIISTLIQGLKVPDAWPWLAAFISSLICLLTNGNRLIYYLRPEWFYFWLPFAMILANISIKFSRGEFLQSTFQGTE
ncbi:MAG: O-antigen ligase family protein [Candidatus Competibacteraceae bacterium]